MSAKKCPARSAKGGLCMGSEDSVRCQRTDVDTQLALQDLSSVPWSLDRLHGDSGMASL